MTRTPENDNSRKEKVGYAIVLRYDLRDMPLRKHTKDESGQLPSEREEERRRLPTHRVEIEAGNGVIFHGNGARTESGTHKELLASVRDKKHAEHDFVAMVSDQGELLMACVVREGTEDRHFQLETEEEHAHEGRRVRFHVEPKDIVYVGFVGKDKPHAYKVFEKGREGPDDDLSNIEEN